MVATKKAVKRPARKTAVKSEPIAVWVYKDGFKDLDGNPIPPESYAYVDKVVDGMQVASTDPLHLKFYKTRVMKADVSNHKN